MNGNSATKKEVRTMTTNDEYLALIKEHNLTSKQVSEIIGVSFHAAENWKRTGERLVPVPKVVLLALKLSISAKYAEE